MDANIVVTTEGSSPAVRAVEPGTPKFVLILGLRENAR